MKTSGIHHLVLTIKDPEKSKEFYTKVCGMKLIANEKNHFAVTDGNFTIFASTSRDSVPIKQEFNRNQIGLDHWAFKVDSMKNLEEIENHLNSLGIKMEENGITDDDFGGTAIFTKDPDGMKIEFHLVK